MPISAQVLRSTSFQHAVVLSYRHLYRTALQSVRYSSPSRYTIRDILRPAFRNGKPEEFDPQRIENTVSFLERAGTSDTMERRILKNITMVRFWERELTDRPRGVLQGKHGVDNKLQKFPIAHYEKTLHLFNESLGLCLR